MQAKKRAFCANFRRFLDLGHKNAYILGALFNFFTVYIYIFNLIYQLKIKFSTIRYRAFSVF